MRVRSVALAICAAAGLIAASAAGQTCRVSSVTGATATITNSVGFAVAGTPADTNTVNGAFYHLSNALGLGPDPVVRTAFSNWVQTAASNSSCTNCDPNPNHPVVYGGAFVNPSPAAVTVTGVTFTTDVDHFTPPLSIGVTPAGGWQFVNRRLVRWTGSVSVASRAGQDFVVLDSAQNNAGNNSTRNVQVTMTVTTNAGTFAGPVSGMTALTANGTTASNATVTFDMTGAVAPVPRVFIGGIASGAPVNFGVRVAETGNVHNNSAIETGLRVTFTIPQAWSGVSLPTLGAPWNAATVAIVQPTATTAGSVTVVTSQRIPQGTVTPPNSLVIRATPPVSSVTNLHPFRLELSGASRAGRPITSFNDSVVQVLGSGTTAISSEFFSAAIGPGPVRQIDFRADLNMINGAGGETVAVQVFNNGTAAWETISTIAPPATNATVSRSFLADFEPYVNGTSQMRIRFVSPGTTARTLRLDQVRWSMTTGYTVNSATGNDANPGHVARPFRTLGAAATSVGVSGAIYVEVGSSRSGFPYAANEGLTGPAQSGTIACPVLVNGVADGSGVRPLIHGVNPLGDLGFGVAADHVIVDGFEITGTMYGLYGDIGRTGITFSNNVIRAGNLAYGIIFSSTTNSSAIQNHIDAVTADATAGIWDFSGSGNVIDGNRVRGFGHAVGGGYGIWLFATSNGTVQRNIVARNYQGIALNSTQGNTRLFNNTTDGNFFLGIYAESAGTVTSRNNSITNNNIGWGWNGIGTIDSNFDNVWNNGSNYSYHGTVAAGANSRSVDPGYVQTASPALPTYYRLGAGSQCIDAGTGANGGLPFLGVSPDIGGVETQ